MISKPLRNGQAVSRVPGREHTKRAIVLCAFPGGLSRRGYVLSSMTAIWLPFVGEAFSESLAKKTFP